MTASHPHHGVSVHVTSFAQEQLWVVDQLDPGGTAYNVTWGVRLDGALDVAVLRQAVAVAVNRHEALRTSFAAVNGRPVQVVHEQAPLSLTYTDLSGESDPAGRTRELLGSDARAPFTLTELPLVRMRLLRTHPERHALALVVHHIVADEWSIGILLADILAAYRDLAAGRPPTLPEPPGRYVDYAARQRRRLTGSRLAELERYWREQLSDAPELLRLPLDRPRGPVNSDRGAVVTGTVDAGTAQRLAALARAEGVTPFMSVLAGFAAVLFRCSGESDVVVGASTADRSEAEFQGVVGFFVNTVVLRTDLSGRPTFRELLARVRATCLAAFAHQDLPLEKIVELVRPRRSSAYQPVFQVMLTLNSAPEQPPEVPGLAVGPLETPDSGGAQFDLSMSVAPVPDGLLTRLQYRTELFDRDTAEDLLGQFAALLAAATAEPDRPVAGLPIVTGHRRERLLRQLAVGTHRAGDSWPAPVDAADSLPARVARVARERPDAVAVSSGEATLTYRELDQRANQVAHHLAAAGVGPEVVVGLATTRGVGFVTGLQGIWRAGGAAVPMDTRQPAGHQHHVLRQSRCRLLLAAPAAAADLAPALAALPADSRPTVLALDDPRLAERPTSPLPARCRPGSLAYVIFTSGTTGVPKGAMVTHAGMLNHALAKLGDLGLTAADVLAQNGPATFDVVIWQCAAPLLVGGRVHVVPDDALADPELLAAEVERGEVTILQAVPSTIGLLLASDRTAARLRRLRWLVPTGDALPTDLVERWLAAHPGVPLLNTYGVTECSDDQCHAVIDEAPGPQWGPIASIGGPVPHLCGYVLDGECQPVPIGVAGELYLGGIGVGRGYVAAPALTADRFVPDPFGEPGGRLYRTGDVVRWRRDGQLEFFGRADNQVKVRGFRVEPGEVEAVLARHPAVRQAVVVARGPAGPGRRLVAYVVAEPDGPPVTAAQLRRFVAGAVPDYMVPDAVVPLAELPVTRHGKLDRDALPAPGRASGPPEGSAPSAGEDPLREMVSGIVARVLDQDVVNGEDDFFDLGGNSLLAVGLLLRLRESCGVALTHAELLRDATIAGITGAVRLALREGRSTGSLAPIPAASTDAPAPASFGQERVWVVEQTAAVPALYVAPLTLRLRLPVGDRDLIASVTELAGRHEMLRTGLRARDGRPVQVVVEELTAPVSVTDLSALPGADREAEAYRRLAADARVGFDLTRPPLWRAHVIRLDTDDVVIGFMLHHVLTDAWSNHLLLRDLVETVRARVDRRPAQLPPLPVRYADFARWQREQLSGERLAALVEHWRSRLAGAPEVSSLPGDAARPAAESHRGGRVEWQLPAQVGADLRRLARDEDATGFMALVAALSGLLHRWTGQTDLVLGTSVAGREHPQLQDVVGFFVNALPLRVALSGEQSFRTVLRHARQTCLDAYAHADLPFEVLVERLQPPRSLARHPFFQVALIMQNTPRPWREAERPVAVPFPAPHTGTAKFDLELQVGESPQGWQVSAEYAADLFEAETVRRFLAQLQELLAAVIRDPDRPIGQLPLLPAAERRAIEGFRAGPRVDSPPSVLPDLVAAQVRATPEAPAVGTGERWLSYREFWAAVTGLAGRLRECGVGPESVVGVQLDRGVELLVAVHAVVAAGAAYLPLPPDQPAERLALMRDDAAASVVVTAGRPAGWLTRRGVRAVTVDGHRDGGGRHWRPAVDGLAYVIYTSGSTGRPKGVQVAHRAIVSHLQWMQRTYPIGPGDRVLHKTPFGFDMSVWELFWPLTVGAAVLVAEAGLQQDPDGLCQLLERHRITVTSFVPSMLGPFLDAVADRGGRLPRLRTVVCGGEDLPARLVGRFQRLLPGVALENLYGPTEATIQVTRQACADWHGTVVPIGQPIDNTWVEVLDQDGQRVPIGATGEICLGGVQLARGYANRPGLTADRFVPDPHGPPASRLYRTGDLGRWRPDGTVECLGRSDHQVKIRGNRVEPAEAEAALAAHPAVADAAVAAHQGRLVAYLVGIADSHPPAAELRAYLASRLPDFLVPAQFVWLPALPVTSNGKLDRSALPAPDGEPANGATGYVEPADPTARLLASIWSEVLGVARVGANDNFFDLGGDSITSLLVVSRAARAGVGITPRQFFDHQTVAGLAAVATTVDGPVRRPGTPTVDARTVAKVTAMLSALEEPTEAGDRTVGPAASELG